MHNIIIIRSILNDITYLMEITNTGIKKYTNRLDIIILHFQLILNNRNYSYIISYMNI